ncbi:Arsenate reductase [Methanosarcina siciliae T4/M]|uniref:Arsenate reductase n=1 Tax=Methanosarcina siciliae T4/M TaxID=1434120 RepID=A0A0E3P6D6_9EURY|nr:arsenate reductase ArsC [Methanosarcina siciliae]AKB29352.1 Arsenate reductase [Methanosarcina siciliae T4/M]
MTSNKRSNEKKKVLFLCTHNSARSQMAEGLLRAIYGERYEAYSAGVKATNVNPHAVQVMKEIGIDISGQYSKTPKEFQDTIFDMAVTVCDRAKVSCPICSTNLELPTEAPKAREVIHKSFEDPAAAVGSEEEQLKVFRQIRDEIKDWISRTFGK